MDNEIKTWLFDVLQSIEEIESYFSDKPKIFETYLKDIKTKRAVERNIEIIGEAVNRILSKESTFMLAMPKRLSGQETELHIDTTRYQTI